MFCFISFHLIFILYCILHNTYVFSCLRKIHWVNTLPAISVKSIVPPMKNWVVEETTQARTTAIKLAAKYKSLEIAIRVKFCWASAVMPLIAIVHVVVVVVAIVFLTRHSWAPMCWCHRSGKNAFVYAFSCIKDDSNSSSSKGSTITSGSSCSISSGAQGHNTYNCLQCIFRFLCNLPRTSCGLHQRWGKMQKWNITHQILSRDADKER